MIGGQSSTNNRATRVVVTSMGLLCGLISIEHGILEILRGNVPTGGILIDAIGPTTRLWENASEAALTLIPNYLVSGIYAVIVGLVVIAWSAAFVHRKYGAPVFFGLTAVQLLVGGGIACLPIAILGGLAATRINKPLTWWRKTLPAGVRRVLAWLWPVSLVAYLILFPLMIAIVIFGLWFLEPIRTTGLLFNLGYIVVGLMALSILGGFAKDIEQQDEVGQITPLAA